MSAAGGARHVVVKGQATPEQVAALLAVLSRRPEQPTAYERWRRIRLAALTGRG